MAERSIAGSFLKYLGADVVKRPESHTKQADFLVTFGKCRILVEEKERIDTQSVESSSDGILSEDGVHLKVFPYKPDNSISGKIQKASKQLESSNEEVAFRLIWYTATGRHVEGKRDQIYATLFGNTQIVDLEKSTHQKCYFFKTVNSLGIDICWMVLWWLMAQAITLKLGFALIRCLRHRCSLGTHRWPLSLAHLLLIRRNSKWTVKR